MNKSPENLFKTFLTFFKSRLFWKIYLFFLVNSLIITAGNVGMLHRIIFKDFGEKIRINSENFHSAIVYRLSKNLKGTDSLSQKINSLHDLGLLLKRNNNRNRFNRKNFKSNNRRHSDNWFFTDNWRFFDDENDLPENFPESKMKLPLFHFQLLNDVFRYLGDIPESRAEKYDAQQRRLLECIRGKMPPDTHVIESRDILYKNLKINKPLKPNNLRYLQAKIQEICGMDTEFQLIDRKERDNLGFFDFLSDEDNFHKELSEKLLSQILIVDEAQNYVIGNAIHIYGPSISIKSGGAVKGTYYFNPNFPRLTDLSHLITARIIGYILYFTFRLLIFCLLISLIFLLILLRPIRKISNGLIALGNRQFDTRIRHSYNDELGKLANYFNEMAESMEEFVNEKKNWASIISHELKTPLTILRGEIEAFQDGVRKITPESLESVRQEIIYLAKLTDDLKLLSFNSNQSFDLEKEQTDIYQFLTSVSETISTVFKQNNLTLVKKYSENETCKMNVDIFRLRQVFTNLFENNVRYAEKPGTVYLNAFRDDNTCVISVEDDGSGVPETEYKKIFEEFYRVEKSRSRRHGGSGLGLAVSRIIVQKHGGEIFAEKSENNGLKIVIKLPVN